MFGLTQFRFAELWSPWFALWMMALVAAYFVLTGPLRYRFADAQPVSLSRKITFVTGMVVYYFAMGGPLNVLAHLMFSMHMTAMAIGFILAPPLILIGLPGWLLRPVFYHPKVKGTFRLLTHPLVAVLAFNTLFSFYHMPAIHDYVMTHYWVHEVYYIALLVSAFIMWWPIIAPIPEQERLTDLRKIAYVFLNGLLITPACVLIIFASQPVYQTYSDPNVWATALGYCVPRGSEEILKELVGPQAFAWLPPRDDQQLGGVIMKVLQEIIYGSALAYIFFNWYINEKKEDPMTPDPLPNP